MSEKKHNLKVGDKLAFERGRWSGWEILPIERITPSGRIVCGRYTLNPDLSVRGHSFLHGRRVTPEIEAKVRRNRILAVLTRYNWDRATDEVLEAVVAITHPDAEGAA